MKEYLLKTFRYNDWANKKLLESIRSLSENTEALKLFSHLISAQNKWYNRITKEKNDADFSWFGQIFPINEIEQEWSNSVKNWISLLEDIKEGNLQNKIDFKRASDGATMRVKLIDLMLQINYHSIHHRAQINTLISKQGQKPPLTDYIFTVLEEA